MTLFSESEDRHIVVRCIIAVLIVILIIYAGASFIGVDKCPVQPVTDVKGDIFHPDGSIQRDLIPSNWIVSGGDTLVVHIHLPKKFRYTYSSLEFNFYNSILDLRIGHLTIYSYGKKYARQNQMIGDILANVSIPESYAGRELILSVQVQEKNSSNAHTEFNLVPSNQATHYPLRGKGLQFLIFLTLMVVGIGIAIGGTIVRFEKNDRLMSLSIGFAILLLCVWYFGFNQMWYGISTNQRFNATVEYVALDLLSVPLFTFAYTVAGDAKRRKIIFWADIITSAYAVGVIILALTHVINMTDALPGNWAVLVIYFLLLLWLTISGSRQKTGFESTMILGTFIAMFFGIIQLISIRVRGTFTLPPVMLRIVYFDYSAWALLSLILTLLISIIGRVYATIRERAEQKELKRIAFIDLPTGIHNRPYLIDKMNSLTNDTWYAIGFFDVDGLKKANDYFGHDVGDALIKETADLISSAFKGHKGWFGRWGGDEFVAIFLDPDELEKFRSLFEERLAEHSVKSILPVPFSVSAGYYVHDEGSEKSVDTIIKEADKRMYYHKREKHADRRN